ncbi:general odorant-binding protein 45-like [Armigeres subalbatus]|uniref:general odorant-binding protein 45-like n=1 Tax=Armigeres subalbatus TaxID=124917 RepID=UPI002ED4E780
MRILAISLFLAVLCTSSAELPTHYAAKKSFHTALQQCAEYLLIPENNLQHYINSSFPNDPSVQRLIRCSLMLLGCWDDSTGVRVHVIENFFQPDPKDCNHIRRARECVRKNTTDSVFSPAYVTFQCYYQQFGHLKLYNEQFIPLRSYELMQLVETALEISNLPWFVPTQYVAGDILYEPHFPPVLLFIFLQGGFYGTETGFDLQRLYTQFGAEPLLTVGVRQCLAEIVKVEKARDHEAIVIKAMQRCLQDVIPLLPVVAEVAGRWNDGKNKAAKTCARMSGSTVPTLPPFYNRVCED